MTLSIITSMYNCRPETLMVVDKLFFASIKQHGSPDRELVILDDHSPLEAETRGLFEGHRRDLEAGYAHVIFRRHDRNRGFGGSFNRGVEIASGRTLIIANDDIYLPKGSVSDLEEVLLESASHGIVGPITGARSTWTVQYCRQAPPLTDYSEESFGRIERFAELVRDRFHGRRLPVPHVSGFCFAIDRDLMKEAGGFDESFGYGVWEDIDLSRRIGRQRAIVVAPEVYVHHGGLTGTSSSLRQHPGKFIYRSILNGWKCGRKWNDLGGVAAHIARGLYGGLTGRGTISELMDK